MLTHFFVLTSLFLVSIAQPPVANDGEFIFLQPLNPGSFGFKRRQRAPCQDKYRAIDGVCTNKRNKLWGSTRRPQFSYISFWSSETPAGSHLKSAREISNILCKQDQDQPNARRLTEFLTFFGQYLDHNLVATPKGDESMDIIVPPNDDMFANTSGILKFTRSERAQVYEGFDDVQRPLNTLTSAIDQVAVYGANAERASALRSFVNGKLKTSPGNLLPFNDVGIANAPSTSNKFYMAGDHRANEHPVLTSLHTIFMREHNRLCDELLAIYPWWNDEDLYQMARKINGAQFQKIVYEEFYPAMTGQFPPRYNGHRSRADPTVSDIFAGAAFRVGHTLVGNTIKMMGPGKVKFGEMTMREMFFNKGDIMFGGFERFIVGAANNVAQEVDLSVVDALRNFLFTNVPEEGGLDLIALNIQRGRDHNLPPYVRLRRMFNVPGRVRDFLHITKNINRAIKLLAAYGNVRNVEAWPGLMAEDHVPGASMGPTMLAIWRREFKRMMDGDRFFYLSPRLFPSSLWRDYAGIRQLYQKESMMKKIILRNTDINSADLPQNLFKL